VLRFTYSHMREGGRQQSMAQRHTRKVAMARAAEGQGSPLVGQLGQHTGEAWAGVEISMENQSGCRRLLGENKGGL
jgi:hypothetical protein